MSVLAVVLAVLATWSAPERVTAAPVACPAAVSDDTPLALGDGRFVALRGRRPELADVDARGRRLGGTPLPVGGEVWARSLACGVHGELASAGVEVGAGRESVRVLRGTGPALTLVQQPSAGDEPSIDDVVLAFAGDGSLLVVVAMPFSVRAATIAPDGSTAGLVELGRADGFSTISADVSASGRAVVAWATQDSGEERNKPERVLAAIREPGAASFGAPQVIDRGGSVDPFRNLASAVVGVHVALADDGHATVLWGQAVGRRRPVRVAESAPGHRFGRLRRLAAGGSPAAVAVRGDGRTIAVWTRAHRLYASLHAPGRRFGRPEAVGVRGEPEWTSVTWLPDGRARIVYETLPRGLHVVTRR